ncbi:unnamed protein product [Rhodiola kirilowii]
MATRCILRCLSLYHLRHIHRRILPVTSALSPFLRRNFSSQPFSRSRWSGANDEVWSGELGGLAFGSEAEKLDGDDNEEWRAKEAEILKDIEGTVELAKEILHSGNYNCGDMLSPKDEEEVFNKLLVYHPHCEEKIGLGLDNIMVDWHPVYGRSRCLFVVRKDGSREDFSYWKCLRCYVELKYPSDAERFISLHLTKRGKAQ